MDIFRAYSSFCRWVVYVVSFALVAVPFHAATAEITIAEAARQGNSFADMLKNSFQYPQQGSGGEIVFPDMGESINVKDLYPGSSNTSKPSSFYFPETNDQRVAEDNWEDGSELDRLGLDKQRVLYDDAVSGDEIPLRYTDSLHSSPSVQGAAYKIILDRKNAAKPDMRKDPMLDSSRQVITDLAADGFNDCKIEEVLSSHKSNIHVPDLHQCERINKPAGECEIEHVIEVRTTPTDVVFLMDNSGSMESAIAALRDGARHFAQLLGDDEDRLRIGGIVTRSAYSSNHIRPTSNINAFQSWVNGVRINSGSTYVTTVGNYVLDHFDFRPDVQKVFIIVGNKDSPGGDHLALKRRLDSLGFKTFVFHDNGAQRQLGQHVGNTFTVNGLLKVAQMLTVVKDEWIPKDCIQDAIATLEEFCEGTYTVTEKASPCSYISGFHVCPGDYIEQKISQPPLPGVNKLDSKIYVGAIQCDFNVGSMGCYEDALGETICPQNEGNNLNTCKEFEADPQCGFIKSECIGGAEGSRGTCYVYNETWDCGETVSFTDGLMVDQLVCDGEIACMGEACTNIERERSDSFGKATALLNVVEHADGLMTCTEQVETECKIFEGAEGTCKIAVGGTVDCCDKPSDVSLGDYLVMLQAMRKLDSAMLAIQQAQGVGLGAGVADTYVTQFRQPVEGVYNAIKEPVVDGFKKLTSPFVNYAESAGGVTTPLTNVLVDQALDYIKEYLGQAAQEFVGSMLQELAVKEAVGGVAANYAGAAAEGAMKTTAQNMGAAVGSALAVIGWIYMIYQVAMLVIQLIYKCEEEELQLMVNVQLKKCTFLGSYCDSKFLGMCVVKKEAYCCYESPLARIVVEQGNKQLGKPKPDPEAPQCQGLTLLELERLDWDKIDLSEWIGMLIQHDLYAGVADIDMESLTGSGSYMPGEGGGVRMNAGDRTNARFEDSHVDDIRVNLQQTLEFSGGANK